MYFEYELAIRLLIAALMGGLIGYEREAAHKDAGLRTHTIVAIGAALTTLIGAYAFETGDPTRIAGSIVTGIGFLGGGTIIVSKGSVKGLTTAATLWLVAALGMGIGVGFYLVTFMAFILVLAVLELNRVIGMK